jgi:multidrug efflux pump subunit AcrA (membrane-fusion protein)
MKKKVIIISVIIATVIALVSFNSLASKKDNLGLLAEAQKGEFEISISSPGELLAESSIDIFAPEITERGRDIRATSIRIQDLVNEGTVVKAGDYIGTLDRTEFENNLKTERERLASFRTDVEMKILDTAMTMTNLRDEIKNQAFAVEESTITLRNSKYEPPTTIRQAEIDLDKQQRVLEQKQRTYRLKTEQVKRDIANLNLQLSRVQRRVTDLEEVLAGFTITAPSPGMVIYKKDRLGGKIKAGSSINTFDRVVATLPDLSVMLSKIYVSEIEISKVKPGQTVKLNVDAFPAKTYTGKIKSVANIGEKLPNTDSKVFEVIIKIDGTDNTLRPAMTTSNKIIVNTIAEAVYIPTECLQTGNDGIPFVYTQNGTKQVVIPGVANDKNIVIMKGLEPGTLVYRVQPEDFEDFNIRGEELIAEIKVVKQF